MKVEKMGGNQYCVSCEECNKTETIDLDGLTIVSDSNYEKIEDAGIDITTFIAPMHADGDPYWEAAANHALNYSGFDVEEYLNENKVK